MEDLENNIGKHSFTSDDLVRDIKKISLNKKDIYSVSMELFDDFTDEVHLQIMFEPFWKNSKFIDLVSNEGQLSIVIGMQAITLADDIPFNDIVDRLFDEKNLDKSLMALSFNFAVRKHIKEYIFHVRKELFNNVYYSNSDLRKISLLTDTVLEERLRYFSRKSTLQ